MRGWPRLQGLPRVQQERGPALAMERGQERVQAHETWAGERARRSCSRLTSGLVHAQRHARFEAPFGFCPNKGFTFSCGHGLKLGSRRTG